MPHWKWWVIAGLGLQVVSVVPTFLLAWNQRTEIQGDTGPIFDIDTRLTRRERLQLLASFLLVAAGAALQGVGAILAP